MSHTRNISRHLPATHLSRFKNVLVSGCSFTFNPDNNEQQTWPYYLRDLCGFEEVYDTSQSGAGTNHIFNSIINEIELNENINSESTLVVIMWSSLQRTDVIATTDMTKDYHWASNYNFDNTFSTLSIFDQPNESRRGKLQEDLCKIYKRVVSPTAQIYESILKILALRSYLIEQNFSYVFTNFYYPNWEFDLIHTPLTKKVKQYFDIEDELTLGNFMRTTNQIIPNDSHPTPECHCQWTQEILIPCLLEKNFVSKIF